LPQGKIQERVAMAATIKGQFQLWASLRRLAWVNVFAVGGLSATLLIVAYVDGISVALAALAAAIVVLASAAALTFLRLRRPPQIPASEHAGGETRERYLLGLATLCAGSAHEMSTPLTTIGVVLGDLRRSETPPLDWKQSVDLLWGQVQICKRSLFELALGTNVERLGKVHRVSARQLVHEVGNRFQRQRPNAQFRLRRMRIDDSLVLESDETLAQALLIFLNRAADASPQSVELRVGRKGQALMIQILDRGPNAAPGLPVRTGLDSNTTGSPGRRSGPGELIAQAVIGHLGGSVQIFDRPIGGTCVQIELPVSRFDKEKIHEYREQRIASG
jgi:two-component system, sensor histidine kinase RegB